MSQTDIRIVHEREGLARTLTDGRTRALLVILGPLHYRHLASVREAAAHCDEVVVAALTGTGESGYQAEPEPLVRPIDAEAHHLHKAGADVYFTPSLDDMYPYGRPRIAVDVTGMPQLAQISPFTENYFQGVAQFYGKLINVVRPTSVYISQKDIFDLAVVRQYVRDFDVPVEVEAVTAPREESGLVADPINHELSDAEYDHALAISQALYAGVQSAAATGSAQGVLATVRDYIEHARGVELIHADLLDPITLEPIVVERGTGCLVVVAKVGDHVLSDNMLVVLRRS